MALFQQSVVKKYIHDLEQNVLKEAYRKYQSHFGNPTIQQNIRDAKEEEYQEGFVRDLFVNILEYTLKPQPGYNFVLEKKNEKDSKKSDGAILSQESVRAIVELKGTETTDLGGKVEVQAFNYKNNQKGCTYVVTSNFEKLRFYIEDAVDFEEFNLFQLSFERFCLLFCCLHRDQILLNIPAKIKNASIATEESVTKKLYADYSNFKKALFDNIVKQNPQYDKVLLFQKTQKLLDRLLFVLFAEDRLLLPPNSVRKIIKDWQQLKELDEAVPLYQRLRKYFGYLNTGHGIKEHEIFAYNGGLFAPDEVLDAILVDDDILANGCTALSNYDFETDVDVNILGHIFEHSLTEIEEVQAELEGKKVEKTKTRRRKDGVFYTPAYITKYMVENTVGNLCRRKKAEIVWNEEEFVPQKRKTNRKQLLEKLEGYRKWLLGITILDPACGSGAFLNQALDFLIREHRVIDELKSKLFGDALVYSDVENEILEHNIFGVDINEEAVEIAKLSLWLRTAKKGRKLNNLSGNIKCGDSLFDDPNVAGKKSFSWDHEFPSIIQNGGFDVIIGNPPYVDLKSLPNSLVKALFALYPTSNNRINLFASFIEKSVTLLRQSGSFSFIIPSALLTQESYKDLRKYLLNETQIDNIVRLPNESFGAGAGEVKVDTIILTFQKPTQKDSLVEIIVYKGFERITEINAIQADVHFFISQADWMSDSNNVFRINMYSDEKGLIEKIEAGTEKLVRCADFSLGVTPYDKYQGHTPDQISGQVFHSTYKKDDTFRKLLAGNDVKRYIVSWNGNQWISYGPWLGAAREQKFFTQKRVIVKQIIDWTDKRIWAALTTEELYNTQNAFNLLAKSGYQAEYLLALLNSKLISYYHRKKFLEEFKDRFQKILIKDCKEFPIKPATDPEQLSFVKLVNEVIAKRRVMEQDLESFVKMLEASFGGIAITNKLEHWPEITFADFVKELKKQKIELNISRQAEWLTFYSERKQKVDDVLVSVSELENEIDRKIYAMYGLTADEVQIVEKAFVKF